MNPLLHASLRCLAGACLLGLLSACRPAQVEEAQVLQIGIIASLVEPARAWGLATVRCAQVIADHHNQRGGFDLGGRKVVIELIVKDDGYDPAQAADVAHELILEGVDYVIGPLGDEEVSAAARALDSSAVFYVHYGFNLEMLSANSLGVLGMPLAEQSLPVLFRHLTEEEGVATVLTVAYATEEGIRQKRIAEQVAAEHGLEVVKLSRFDVSEETFGADADAASLRLQTERIVAAAPEALIVASCPPELFVVLVDRLRRGGYTGFICAQNFQDHRLLAELGPAADGVFYVGGVLAGDSRSAYYETLKAHYLELAGEWSEEAETKLYALEFILACLRHAGPAALEDTARMYSTLSEIEFEDPFYTDGRVIPVVGVEGAQLHWQIQTPIRISKIYGGESQLVGASNGAI